MICLKPFLTSLPELQSTSNLLLNTKRNFTCHLDKTSAGKAIAWELIPQVDTYVVYFDQCLGLGTPNAGRDLDFYVFHAEKLKNAKSNNSAAKFCNEWFFNFAP